jgi:hypothetical protein
MLHDHFHVCCLGFLNVSIQIAQKLVPLIYFLALTVMFIFKPASQFVERYHNVVTCALNAEDLISKNVYKFCK